LPKNRLGANLAQIPPKADQQQQQVTISETGLSERLFSYQLRQICDVLHYSSITNNNNE